MSGNSGATGRDAESGAADRRRLAEVFGDVLPETTSDEREPVAEQDEDLRWYRENRPPHHDR